MRKESKSLLFYCLGVFSTSLVACSAGGVGGARNAGADIHPMVGVHAPTFSRPAVIGGGTLSSEGAKGKVLIVDFWATYCKPCENEFPKLQALVEKRGGAVAIYGLSEDESRDGIAAFARKTGVKFPLGWDESNSISQRYKLDKMPTSYVIDKRGIIRFVNSGYDEGDETQIASEVDSLLR